MLHLATNSTPLTNNTNSLTNNNNERHISIDFVRQYFVDRQTCYQKCCKNNNDTNKNIERIINLVYRNVNLDDKDKELLLIRYINIIKKIESKYRKHSAFYTWSSLFSSISSILVTALISINNLADTFSSASTAIWWMAWSLSLGISLVNTIGTFHKWDRKYLLMFKVFYRIEQEIWMYLELVGPYKERNPNATPNNGHKNKFGLFMTRLELFYKRINDNLIDIEENEQDDKDTKNNSNNSEQNYFENSDVGANSNEINNTNFIKLNNVNNKNIGKKTMMIIKDDSLINLSDDNHNKKINDVHVNVRDVAKSNDIEQINEHDYTDGDMCRINIIDDNVNKYNES